MRLTGFYSLDVIHGLNILYGAMTGVAVYYLARLLWRNDRVAFAAGTTLAFNAWWIATNTEGVVESLLALVTILAIYYWLRRDFGKMLAVVFVAGFVKYEAWLITAVIGVLMILRREIRIRRSLLYAIAWLMPVAVWSAWSWTQTGDWLRWFWLQRDLLAWDISILGSPASPLALLYYPMLITWMTAGLFVGALAVVVVKSDARYVLAIALTYLATRSLGYALGGHLPLDRFVVLLIPLTYVLGTRLVGFDIRSPRRRVVLGALMTVLIAGSLAVGIFRLPGDGRTYYPLIRAGLWLQQNYEGGMVVNDLPTVIGYSYPNPAPEHYLSTAVVYGEYVAHGASLRWLYDYFGQNNVVYFVWHRVPYSASWQLDETGGSFLRINAGTDSYFFKLVYSDTAAEYWEHEYGIPNLYIFKIDYSGYWLQEGNLPN
jgi:hypothetical protein